MYEICWYPSGNAILPFNPIPITSTIPSYQFIGHQYNPDISYTTTANVDWHELHPGKSHFYLHASMSSSYYTPDVPISFESLMWLRTGWLPVATHRHKQTPIQELIWIYETLPWSLLISFDGTGIVKDNLFWNSAPFFTKPNPTLLRLKSTTLNFPNPTFRIYASLVSMAAWDPWSCQHLAIHFRTIYIFKQRLHFHKSFPKGCGRQQQPKTEKKPRESVSE